MPALKRTNASVVEQKTKRPRLRLNIKKECGINISLPSPEWFDKTYGPIEDDEDSSNNVTTAANTSRARVKVTAKTTARKKANGQKIKKKSNNAEEPEIIEISDDEVQFNEEPQISDGEELFVAFPQSTSSLNGSDGNSSTISDAANLNIGISRCQQKADSSLNPTGEADDDDGDSDIMILFEKMAQRPEPEKPAIKKDEPSSSNQENRVVQPVVLASTEQQPSTSQKSSPKHKSPKKVDWEQVFGVIPHPDRRCYELIAKYRQKYTKEFRYLDKSIWRHMSDNIQNDHTYTWKMRVKNILQDMIRQMHPDQKCDLLPVGSTVNGCGAFNSDMDLCLCLPSIDDGFTAHRSVAAKLLKKIQKRLFKERAFIHRILHIPAKVPILRIRFCPPYEELEVDMNLNNLPGIYNSYLLHHYSRIDDRFPALCLLIKHWAKRQGIGDASAGFFNSYSLILMVLHFLQCGADPPILPNLQKLYPDHFVYCKPLSEMHLFQALPRPLPEVPENKQTVGELLIAFFVYFNKFDFNRNGISIHRGGVFDRDVLPRNCRRFKIFIEEPFDWQNTARCVTDDRNWEMIKRAFQLASMHFTTSRGPPDLNNLIS